MAVLWLSHFYTRYFFIPIFLQSQDNSSTPSRKAPLCVKKGGGLIELPEVRFREEVFLERVFLEVRVRFHDVI